MPLAFGMPPTAKIKLRRQKLDEMEEGVVQNWRGLTVIFTDDLDVYYQVAREYVVFLKLDA